MTARGIRNNNPGNIRISKEKWQGLAENQNDKSFFVFKSSEWGIRALVKILRTYQKKYGLKSIKEIIKRFAPPVENNTDAYIKAVSKAVGVLPDAEIDVFNSYVMTGLLKAIIAHENGSQPYSEDILIKGMRLADE